MSPSTAAERPASPDEGDAPPTPALEAQQPDQWVERHGDALLGYALARVNDMATAEDLVQETLLTAWRSRDKFDGRASFRTWLVAILRRRIADHYRGEARKRRPAKRADDSATPFDKHGKWAEEIAEWPADRTAETPEKIVENAEFWDALARCSGSLPAQLERAFRLREFGRGSVEEICEHEGITRKNLSVRLHRARLMLRKCLENSWFCERPAAEQVAEVPAEEEA
ncbi:RNA polymerase sigma factor YlaC [Pseudobythopirellula maris]|uniref:RNA polymerase sigma factor n=1 Tax=Pseudobythopirellula maris TaxID=2527991 RepID=A0A5C5ZMQ8_9BACT|nr:sigma-70 family RNA polymerase sigma factor [Pseudobythopirellula maris]TWT88774.1 RNA polymerase sigma factor YlaC [Pseudobythopirellula maris]